MQLRPVYQTSMAAADACTVLWVGRVSWPRTVLSQSGALMWCVVAWQCCRRQCAPRAVVVSECAPRVRMRRPRRLSGAVKHLCSGM
jgi:hypothetical protein